MTTSTVSTPPGSHPARSTPHSNKHCWKKPSRLRALYAGHIHTEESTVFPAAARILDRDALAAIGSEFRARRIARPKP